MLICWVLAPDRQAPALSAILEEYLLAGVIGYRQI
jgi:hypothetical protein